jgi:NADH:ubiquinone oxidoreductase subunit F (NADH-binding)
MTDAATMSWPRAATSAASVSAGADRTPAGDAAGRGPAGRGPAIRGLPRLLPHGHGPATRQSLDSHVRYHGPLPYRGRGRGRRPSGLIADIAAAGLTGRGGAAFPTAKKMTAVADGRRRPVVVGNGAEGEPASGKDKHLLWVSPHLVLDGLQLAAEAVGARRAYLYVHSGGQLHEWLRHALAERSATRCDQVEVNLVSGPPRFLAGEESALVNRIDGGLALPTFRPPRTFERGVGGAPTLVQNVETLAHVALIARHGAAWFREVGTSSEPGSMLTTCHRADGTTEIAEVAIGTSLAVLLRLGGAPAQAVLTGGYHGTWIRAADAAGLRLANGALRQEGAVLGAGVLAALPPDRCGLAETAHVVRYLAAESAGQCGPCRSGLPRIADALTHLSGLSPDPRWLTHLQRWSGLVTGRGACHHPDGTVRFVRSALTVFAGEIAAHRRGRCTAAEASRPAAGARAPFLPVPAGVPAYAQDWR